MVALKTWKKLVSFQKGKWKHFWLKQTLIQNITLPEKKFPRLKVQAYRINEIWSIDVAYMDKLAKYNNGVKYLLVAVDVLSRFLRVEPMKTKSAADSTRAFKRMITKSIPEKIWSDKGSEFKGEFKQFCDSKNIDIYSTHSGTKSAFAERNIRSLKNIIYKHLEKRWSYQYIKKLHDFVDIINSRVNRVTGLAPKKVSDKDVPHLISLVSYKSTKQLRVPKFRVGDFVRVSKENLPFKKGYKQNFTDEIFQIEKIATLNPPTYNLLDSEKGKLLGKFYQPELILVKKKNGRIWSSFIIHSVIRNFWRQNIGSIQKSTPTKYFPGRRLACGSIRNYFSLGN